MGEIFGNALFKISIPKSHSFCKVAGSGTGCRKTHTYNFLSWEGCGLLFSTEIQAFHPVLSFLGNFIFSVEAHRTLHVRTQSTAHCFFNKVLGKINSLDLCEVALHIIWNSSFKLCDCYVQIPV